MRGLSDLFVVLQDLLPPWALALLGVVVAAFVVPRMLRAQRDKQARGQLRQAARAAPEDRAARIDRAFEIAGDDVDTLYSLALDAHTRQLPEARRRALEALAAHPKGRRLRAILDTRWGTAATAGPTAFERAATIRSLQAEDRLREARVRLDEALRAFPRDPDLRALDDALTASMLDVPEGGR